MKNLLKSFWAEEDGAAAIEYALIAALIALAIIVGSQTLGNEINDVFKTIANKLGNTV